MSTRTHFYIGNVQYNEIGIMLNQGTITKLFDEAFEGWCPICHMHEINDGESICCDCLTDAMAYHHNHCGCLETSGRDEAR